MAISTRPTATTLDFTLLENGLDFLLHAVEHLSWEPTGRDLKQGVVNLAGGVELILKERLRQHDWRLLFADTAKANAQDLANGNFKSAGPDATIERLHDEAGVLLDPATVTALKLLRRQRNQINHFAITAPANAVLALAAAALAFTLDFIGDELDGDELEGRAAIDLELLRQATVEFNTFVDERWREIKPRVEAAMAIVTCADCGQDAAEIDDGVRCHFCGYRATPQLGAEEFAAKVLGASYYDSVKNAEYWPISFCPDCGMETLVDEGLNDASEVPTRKWVCFACACAWDDNELHSCDTCSAFHPDKFGIGMCDNCFDWRVNGPGSD
jgi:hypothetical protein